MNVVAQFIGTQVEDETKASTQVRSGLLNLKEICIRVVSSRFNDFSRLQRLPDDVKDEIFRFLTSDSRNRFDAKAACALLRRDQPVLTLSYCTALRQETLEAISVHCPQVVHLYLHSCVRLSSRGLQTLLDAYAPTLESLDLSRCYDVADALASVALLPNLRRLSLRGTRVTDDVFRKVVTACTKLEELNVARCGLRLSNESLLVAARCCPRLRALDVGSFGRLDDLTISAFVQERQRISLLCVEQCGLLTDKALRSITSMCAALQVLNFSHSAHLTAESIASLSACRQLRVLVMRGSTTADSLDPAIESIVVACPELQMLDLANASVTDRAGLAIAAHCRNLESLALTACAGITGSFLAALASQCLLLSQLKLTSCAGVTAEHVRAFGERLPADSCLRELDLARVSLLTPAALLAVASRASQLVDVAVSDVGSIDDQALLAIVRCLPLLKFFDCQGCHLLTSDALAEARRLNPRLSIFHRPLTR
eukprot:TRINITY_DN5662_c0_g1_i1.p1 TRINITY_DN5662_c0_g1~~TRINITY_DN5662_c0_g1_i1.p1  ORF type:complete len:485 (+),score=117.23 TRINITY_DN5662_c0_g1_i1:1384-2838(+)